jgi:DNA (cytosine-5)-methyltransferase 1
MAVRRLTPRECERLQGAEDDWTLVPSGPKGKPMADGPRYKMLGNSFARPVITWIGRQIERAVAEGGQGG